MTQPVPPDVLRKVRKLAHLPDEVRQARWAVSVTRLTVLKGLCQDAEVANRFVTYLARKTLERVEQGQRHPAHGDTSERGPHREMMAEALAEMEAWTHGPTDERRQRLQVLLALMREEQNEYKRIKWGAVRLITDANLLLREYALRCLVSPPSEAGHWAYQTARHYAERYHSSQGSGLTAASAPLLKDIADFWTREYDLDPEALVVPPRAATRAKEGSASPRARKSATAGRQVVQFTRRQGQFLAFIHLYRKLHRRGPAELDMVQYFRVTPPSAHGMLVKLEQLGLVTKEQGVPRSVRVAIPEEQVPALEAVAGPPW